ncbi:MATE family efflux transporter [Eubacteriales bacterium OttesenSCG-928-N13]|nr:MATE family efflux transporter [Eubacteriales bacterium OttesenSCG-928-N13]
MNYFRKNRAFFSGILAIGIPIAMQNLLTTAVSVVDTFMVSSQGQTVLASVGLCSQFSSLYFSFYWGFASAGTLFFAQYWGNRDRDGISHAYGITVAFMAIVAVVFTSLGLFAPELVLRIYTDKPDIQAAGVPYLRILALSFPGQAMAIALSCLMRSTENVRVPLIGSVVSMVINTSLNYVLIFGKFGAPAMGVQGAAIASVIAMYANVAVLYLFSFRDKDSLATRFREHMKWPRGMVREYLGRAAPMLANELFYGTGQLLITVILGRQNEAGVAAIAVFRVIEGMIFSFFVGLSNASSVMVGKEIGAGNVETGYDYAKRFAWICPLITLFICLVILPISPLIVRGFDMSDAARNYVVTMLAIYCIGGPLRTCNYIMNNTYRAGGEPRFGAVFEIGSLFLISVPLVYLSGMVWQLPFLLVFASMYVEEALKLGIGVRHLLSAHWIRPVTEEGRIALATFMQKRGKAAKHA